MRSVARVRLSVHPFFSLNRLKELTSDLDSCTCTGQDNSLLGLKDKGIGQGQCKKITAVAESSVCVCVVTQ